MSKWITKEFFYYFSLFTQIGLTVVIHIGGFLFLYLVLAKYGFRHPILMFLFLILGIMSAYYRVYKMIMKKK